MIDLFKQLEGIEAASGSNMKKKLLGDFCRSPEHKEILGMALNPLFPMYLGREAKFKIVDPEISGHYETDNLILVMNNLHDGVIGRGAPAHAMTNEFIGGCADQGLALKWIPRLFTKDLQIGVSWETFTKVNGEKKFAVMLAKDINKIKNQEKKFVFPVYVQPKLDGYRAFSNAEGEHELRSRNGKEYKNFPQIVEALKKVCPDYLLLDGEIMSDDFQAMQKTAFRQDGKEVGDVRYHVFDIVTQEEWDAREGKFDFEARYDSLVNLVESHPLIEFVETHECDSWAAIYAWHDIFKAAGHEGTMIRANKPYQFKRTDYLAKIKDMLSMDCEVRGMEEGRNSLSGSMGHMVVTQENGVECGVGSGFTKEDRGVMWEFADLYMGRIAEIKYQELTKDGVMRFPVFVRWRDDK